MAASPTASLSPAAPPGAAVAPPSPPRPVPATVAAAFAPAKSLADAQAYARRLTLGHYENFSVVSILVPRHLRQDFANVYAFCRTADDLGDEVGHRGKSLELLGRFRDDLRACYAGQATSVISVPLADTIRKFDIPITPFADL
ncbi:MAG TPA: squalene/phytoene synthase family protein, partial [Tepidisphaeraceae bacterium]|nr:squalene/phytoene synthase family protein [Tepidisphaeraceae bacterium]